MAMNHRCHINNIPFDLVFMDHWIVLLGCGRATTGVGFLHMGGSGGSCKI